jgi:carbonic anhydrase
MAANTILENVRLTVRLLAESNEFAAMVDQGKVSIVGAIYDVDTGQVTIGDRSHEEEGKY